MSFSTKSTWAEVKDFVDKTKLITNLNYKEFSNHYLIWIDYEGLSLWCTIDKANQQIEDFINNYVPNAVVKKTILENGTKHLGTQGVLNKQYIRKYCCQFSTSTYNNPMNYFSFSILNENRQAVTEFAEAVYAIVRFEPDFDYWAMGGMLQMLDYDKDELIVNVIGNPDIPAEYGGSVYIIKDEKVVDCSPIIIEGKEAMPLKYIIGAHTNVIQIEIKHQPGLIKQLQAKINFYS